LNGISQSSTALSSLPATDHLGIVGSAVGSLGAIDWRTDTQASASMGGLHAFSKSFVGNLTTGNSGRDYVFSYSGNPQPSYYPTYSEVGAPGALAHLTANDIIFSAPAGSSATTVTASLQLELSGSLTTGVTLGVSDLGSGAFAAVMISANLGVDSALPGSGFGGSSDGFMRLSQSGATAPYTDSAGLLTGAVFDGTTHNHLSLASMTFPVGVPVSLSLSLETATRAYSYGFAEAFGLADFSHTLSLPTGGIAFDGLPTGFSVNSTSLGILNNQYSAVPEPSGWGWILGLGCLFGGAIHTGRRKRSQG